MASPALSEKLPATPRSLVRKLSEVMAAVKRIAKRGRNEHFKYDFATEADIAEAIRNELAERRVMLVPEIQSESRIEIGKTSSGSVKTLTVLDLIFTFYDGDSGEEISRQWKGYGVDSEDKGGYKALTGGEKYFLLKTFLIPTGDDPEREDKDTKRLRDKATAKPTTEVKRERKARGRLPEGVCYIDKVVPKSKGNAEWAEIVTSEGEELIAHAPGLITLATNLAQEAAPVEITVSRNAKGNLQIDELARWRDPKLGPTGSSVIAPPEREPGSDDVGPDRFGPEDVGF